MPLIYRLGLIAAVCAVAAIAGLSIAFLATPHIAPILMTSAAAISAPTSATDVPLDANGVPTASTAARLQVPTAPATSAAAPSVSTAPMPAAIPVRSAAEILQQVRASISRMRTGRLEASIDYGNGNRSVASVVFDLGSDLLPSKFAITTTYEGPSGRQIARRTTIDDRTWQRQADAAWVVQQAQESASGELRAFLPELDAIKDIEAIDDEEGLVALHWSGANGADTTLLIDPDTNIPRQMRQLARDTGTLFTVTYQSWNAPVEINPPN